MKLNTYLTFGGNCEEAFNQYAEVLNGELIVIMKFRDMPPSEDWTVPDEALDQVMHTTLQAGDCQLMGSDNMPGAPYAGISGASVSINLDDVAEAERIFNALSEGGSVEMPFGPTFWAKAFGLFTDRFGVSWMVNVDLPE